MYNSLWSTVLAGGQILKQRGVGGVGHSGEQPHPHQKARQPLCVLSVLLACYTLCELSVSTLWCVSPCAIVHNCTLCALTCSQGTYYWILSGLSVLLANKLSHLWAMVIRLVCFPWKSGGRCATVVHTSLSHTEKLRSPPSFSVLDLVNHWFGYIGWCLKKKDFRPKKTAFLAPKITLRPFEAL